MAAIGGGESFEMDVEDYENIMTDVENTPSIVESLASDDMTAPSSTSRNSKKTKYGLAALCMVSLLAVAIAVGLVATNKNESLDTSYVIGGTETDLGRYPYAVSLQGRGRHFCGGSLIAPNVVLSVAHCHQPMVEVKAVIGRHDLRNTNVGEEIIVKEQIPHPQYDEASTDFDYMIMILERDATEVTDFVKVSSEFVGSEVAVTTMGYGDTYSPHDVKYPAPILQEAEVFTFINEDCDATTGTLGGTESHGWMVGGVDGSYEGMISDQMLCASDIGKDSCYGDSGGPLIIKRTDNKDVDRQIGLVSWGFGCAHVDFPAVYSRISSQYNWIKTNVCEEASSNAPDYFECGADATNPLETNEDDVQTSSAWTTIYKEEFTSPVNMFLLPTNNAAWIGNVLGRTGTMRIAGGDNGVSVMKSNSITMKDNVFTGCKITFGLRSARNFTVPDQAEDLCLEYSLNDEEVTDDKCWDSSAFPDRKWYDGNSFEFKLPSGTENMRLKFTVYGDGLEDEVLIDSVTIEGKKTNAALSSSISPSSLIQSNSLSNDFAMEVDEKKTYGLSPTEADSISNDYW